MRQSLMAAVIELNEEIDNVHAPICEQAQVFILNFNFLVLTRQDILRLYFIFSEVFLFVYIIFDFLIFL